MKADTTHYGLKHGGQWLKSFKTLGWEYELTDNDKLAMQFDTMTLALTVGFCLGFGSNMEAVPVWGQLDLWP